MKKTLQRGFTLIEILGGLAIGSLMLAGLTALIDSSLEDAKGQQAALYQAQVVSAATKYIQTNYDTLVTQAVGAVKVVSLADLQAIIPPGTAPYLSPRFSATNAYNQNTCILLRTNAAGKLDALVTTYDGQVIADKDIASVAANAGAGSGYINKADPTIAQGMSWKLDSAALNTFVDGTCLKTDSSKNFGHLVSGLFFDGPGQLSTNYLYRNKVQGRPELNKMTTPLFLPGTAEANKQEPGKCDDTLSTWGAISSDVSGAVLSCESGYWRNQGNRFWKDPVEHFTALPMSDNRAGDVRLEKTKNRAYAWNENTGSWVPLALDEDGNLTANRITTKDIKFSEGILKGSNCSMITDEGVFKKDSTSNTILSCQGGKWSGPANIRQTSTVTDCQIIRKSKYVVTDEDCPNVFPTTGFTYDPVADTFYAPVTVSVAVGKGGMISVSAWSQMARSLVSDPTVEGEFEITAEIFDSTGALIGYTWAQSTKLVNDSAAINLTLLKAVEAGIYTVVLTTSYSLFIGPQAEFFNEANYDNYAGAVIQQTPIKSGWTIDTIE